MYPISTLTKVVLCRVTTVGKDTPTYSIRISSFQTLIAASCGGAVGSGDQQPLPYAPRIDFVVRLPGIMTLEVDVAWLAAYPGQPSKSHNTPRIRTIFWD